MSKELPDQLPIEWSEKIKIEAEKYIDKEFSHYAAPHLLYPIYEAGANTYALRSYKAEQEVEKLARLLRYVKACIEQELDNQDIIDFIGNQLSGQPEYVEPSRPSGYYKVKLNNNWIVAEYISYIESGSHWYVCGNEVTYHDHEFQEIGSRVF